MMNLAIILQDKTGTSTLPFHTWFEVWTTSQVQIPLTTLSALLMHHGKGVSIFSTSSASRIRDPWITTERSRTTSNGTTAQPLFTSALGWTLEEAAEVRLRLLPFEEDWNAPGMDVYDAL